MTHSEFQLRPVGIVRSALTDIRDCPRQENEDAPGAWIDIDREYSEALKGLRAGDEILIMTWLHLADRSILMVHPRGNPENPMRGVFATRSPHRPNPIGLHRTHILSVESPHRLHVRPLEVVDKTPVVDIKPFLSRH